MTTLDRQIRRSQHRLWWNRGIGNLSCVVGIAAGAFAIVVLVQRLFNFAIPLLWIGVGLSSLTLLAVGVWTVLTCDDAASAAAKLDEAAGLKERISSGHYCQGSDDPFAAAVVADAERIGGSLAIRQHIRLQVPRSLALSTGSIVIAALMFLITPGLLKQAELDASEQNTLGVQQAKVAVKRKMEAIRKMAESSPALEDFKDDLAGLDKKAGGALHHPEDIRHEAIKKIETLADAVKQKRRGDQYDAVKETRKAFRRLKTARSSDAPTNKLTQSLARGDFKSAKEEIKALQEQLATLKAKQDQEMAARISKQLDDLSKQLEKLASHDNLAKKLEQAGIKKEDVERMLENLSKKDLDQIRDQLEKKGFAQKKIDKLAKQLQQQQRAGSAAEKLSKSMKQGARCKNPSQMGEALAGLSQASEQLSDLEALEQEMTQLDSTLEALQDAKNDLDKPCPKCGGTGKGCDRCGGTGRKGPGMGRRMGQGRGGLASEEQTNVDFKTERGKVHTGKGAIIGQFYFEGEQVKGEVTTDLATIVSAAERDASDRINRDRVPRQYRKAIKTYFSTVRRSIEDAKNGKNGKNGKSGNGEDRDRKSNPTSDPDGANSADSGKTGVAGSKSTADDDSD